MRRVITSCLTILALAAAGGGCAEKQPEKTIHIKVKNGSEHPIKLSYHFFIRTSYQLMPLLDRLPPGAVEEVEIKGSPLNPTFVLIAEALDKYRPKAWYKLVGRLSLLDDGKVFEIKNRHVEPPGAEAGGFPTRLPEAEASG